MTGFHDLPLPLNSLYSWQCPWTLCHYVPNAGITGMYHHTHLNNVFFNVFLRYGLVSLTRRRGEKETKIWSSFIPAHLGRHIWGGGEQIELDQKHPLGYHNRLKDNVTVYFSASPKHQHVLNAVYNLTADTSHSYAGLRVHSLRSCLTPQPGWLWRYDDSLSARMQCVLLRECMQAPAGLKATGEMPAEVHSD